jgi:hypothetical protein
VRRLSVALLVAAAGCGITGIAHTDPLPGPVPAGTWAAYPNSQLRPAMGPNPPWNPIHIFDYSGGWYDDDRDELGIWGGGHGDYPGNEVCVFPRVTGRWTCLTKRSPYVMDPTTDVLADGNPASRHTYSCIARVNVTGYDGFFCHGGSLWRLGYPTEATWFFHRDTLKWERLADRPHWGESDYGRKTQASYAVFDAARNQVLVRGRNACMSFDMRTKSWTYQGPCFWSDRTASAAFDPERRVFIVMGAGIFEAWDTSKSPWKPLKIPLLGDQTPVKAWGPGFAFDPVGKRYLAYTGGQDLYELNRDTWSFSRIPAKGDDPGPAYPVGTHGRFRYVAKTHGLILVNSIDGNVFYFQLAPPAVR